MTAILQTRRMSEYVGANNGRLPLGDRPNRGVAHLPPMWLNALLRHPALRPLLPGHVAMARGYERTALHRDRVDGDGDDDTGVNTAVRKGGDAKW